MRDFKARTFNRTVQEGVGGKGQADPKNREQVRQNCGNKGIHVDFWKGARDQAPPLSVLTLFRPGFAWSSTTGGGDSPPPLRNSENIKAMTTRLGV